MMTPLSAAIIFRYYDAAAAMPLSSMLMLLRATLPFFAMPLFRCAAFALTLIIAAISLFAMPPPMLSPLRRYS